MNAPSSMRVTDAGRLIVSNKLQKANAPTPISVVPSPNVTLLRLEQLLNEKSPIAKRLIFTMQGTTNPNNQYYSYFIDMNNSNVIVNIILKDSNKFNSSQVDELVANINFTQNQKGFTVM